MPPAFVVAVRTPVSVAPPGLLASWIVIGTLGTPARPASRAWTVKEKFSFSVGFAEGSGPEPITRLAVWTPPTTSNGPEIVPVKPCADAVRRNADPPRSIARLLKVARPLIALTVSVPVRVAELGLFPN